MTYILGTNKISNKKYFKDENGCDICEKITYLGIYNMNFIFTIPTYQFCFLIRSKWNI